MRGIIEVPLLLQCVFILLDGCLDSQDWVMIFPCIHQCKPMVITKLGAKLLRPRIPGVHSRALAFTGKGHRVCRLKKQGQGTDNAYKIMPDCAWKRMTTLTNWRN